MKIIKFFTITFALITVSFTALNAQEISSFRADVTNSTVNWKGYKPTGSHNGTINLASGELQFEEGAIKGGSFTVEMSSIKDAGGSGRLEGHLKSGDFFDVKTFTTSKFEITGVENTEGKVAITGDMTIKGITKQLTFIASVTETEESVTLISETFHINRADFNVKYKSKSFFNNLKEKFINDEFDLQVVIVAAK